MLRVQCAFVALVLAGSSIATGASAQATGGRLKSIASNKTINIAYRTDAAPFSFLNEKKEAAGYTIDICKSVVTSLEKQFNIQGLKIEWIPVTAQSRFDIVASGQADLECGSSTVTLARMKLVDFSNFVFVESTGLVVKTASGINSLKDLAGKKIAVIAGTTNENAVAAKIARLQINATIMRVQDRDEAAAALASGEADAFANDKLLLVGTQFNDAQTLRMLTDDVSIEPYAIVLPRGDWELRLGVNTALAEIYRGGVVMNIYNKWFSPIGLRPSLVLGAAYALGALSD